MSAPQLASFEVAKYRTQLPQQSASAQSEALPDLKTRVLPELSPRTSGAGQYAEYLRAPLRLFASYDSRAAVAATRRSASFGWLADLYSLVARHKTDDAVDILFRSVDEMLLQGELKRCDDMLRTVDLKRLDTNLLVGLLTITLSAADQLPFRPRLLNKIEDRLKSLAPGRVDRLLAGLR